MGKNTPANTLPFKKSVFPFICCRIKCGTSVLAGEVLLVKSPVRFRQKHNNRWLETFWSLDYFSFICTFTFSNVFVYCAFPYYITDLLKASYGGPAPFDTFYTPMKFIYDEYIATLLPIGRHKCTVLACQYCATAAVNVLICTARINANSCSILGAGTV